MPEDSSKLFFTSDHHFGHANIIRYDKRPFKDVEEMDEHLILKWNSVVKPGDTVYHIGDIFWYKDVSKAKWVRSRLNGNIRLVRGNHDATADQMKDSFDWIKDYYEVKVSDPEYTTGDGVRQLVLLHYAMRVWRGSHRGAWHLYGHSHHSLPDLKESRSFDVGVNGWDYKPLSYEEIKNKMKSKSWKAIDHHGKDSGGD